MPRPVTTRRRAEVDSPRRSRDVEPDEREEETPRRGRVSSRPARGSRDDDDADERPSRNARAKSKPARTERSSGGKGWGSYKEHKASSSSYNAKDELRVPENKSLTLKFLEPYPFYSYREHWVNGRGKGDKKSFVCGGTNCPLCDVGHDEWRVLALFNVVDLSDGTNKYLTAGPNLADAIEEQADSEDLAPDDPDDEYDEDNSAPVINQPGLYFTVSKKKTKNGFFDHNVNPVWEERLKVDPLTEEEEDEALDNLFDDSVIYQDKESALRDVADEYLDSIE